MREGAYLLVHESKHNGDIKIIGLYSDRKKADMVISKLITKPGFREDVSGFCVEFYKFNEDNWIDGFITVHHEDGLSKK